ncbi:MULTISPECIES: hypothetical protein [Vibrio]|uniref:hypothetical protein n=1 Tax=Vibrio TaxID=662 RepID=UPI000878763F|nr:MULTISPECIES: hypothetical protein [Vibrio]AOW84215.1 hypothetical protein VM_16000 [Vibrio mimicus]AYC07043.1 hypothetical protein FORC73_3092 [Vibrio cholerae]EKF9475841.1 hypothetical protein [Vibrio cholerae]
MLPFDFSGLTSLTGGGALTGGHAAPSGVGSENRTTTTNGFDFGSVNFGSNNGMPSWMLGLLALGALYVYTKAR